MKILLTGAHGQLGQALQQQLAGLGQVQAFSRAQLDLSEPEALRQAVRQLKPHVVVNAGAYTAVDKAEQEPELAWRINAQAPEILAQECRTLGALLLHYSSDYVFAGNGQKPHQEQDSCAPINQYGASKLAGEQAISHFAGEHLILRTSWVYSLQGHNFLRTMLRLLSEREQLSVVADQVGAPTWTEDLAQASAQLIQHWTSSAPSPSGIYHACAAGETSWYGFACAIAEHLQARGQPCAKLLPISSSQYPTPAKRPQNSRLDNAKLLADYGISLSHWRCALARCLQSLPAR